MNLDLAKQAKLPVTIVFKYLVEIAQIGLDPRQINLMLCAHDPGQD